MLFRSQRIFGGCYGCDRALAVFWCSFLPQGVQPQSIVILSGLVQQGSAEAVVGLQETILRPTEAGDG